MKTLILSSLLLLAHVSARAQQRPVCDAALQQHIYRPDRLSMEQPCITVSGIAMAERLEKSSNIHMRVRLDPQFANLLN
jgi:hypothetical protein